MVLSVYDLELASNSLSGVLELAINGLCGVVSICLRTGGELFAWCC